MKTDVTTPGSLLQSQVLNQKSKGNNLTGAKIADPSLLKASPDYTVELASKGQASSVSIPSLPQTPSIPTPSFSSLPEAPVKDLIQDAAKDEAKTKAKESVIKDPEVKAGSVKRAAIFFIKGLDVFSSPSNSEGGYAGVGRIAESIEGSRIYGWDQKDEMLKEIRKIHPDYPVVLVGHSLGGDTAVEIADELDGLKEKFRPVDLLVTIDAIGFNHDVIPQNVKKHLNVFGENSYFLKDGPHVARREEKTSVRNILSPLDHTDIDDDREVQFEIVGHIQDTLKNVKA